MRPESPQNRWKRRAAACVTIALAGGFGSLLWQELAARKNGSSGSNGSAPVASTGGVLSAKRLPDGPHPVGGTAVGDDGGRKELLRVKGEVMGSSLPAPGLNPHADKGRVVRLDPVAVRSWGGMEAGTKVLLPGVDGSPMEGVVNLVLEDNGWLRIGGDLEGRRGTFHLNTDFNEMAGQILIPEQKVGYEITMDGAAVVLVERRLSSLVCADLLARGEGAPLGEAAPLGAGAVGTGTTGTASAVLAPILNSRPGAKGVIFLAFDGETVTDPVWNGGKTVVAARANMSAAQITEVVKAVTEDYAPFDVTVTTDRTVYDATAPGLRMKAIVTPTTTVAPGYGGYAMIGSWRLAGKSYKSDTPCWIFNMGQKTAAETISHEVGHTLGLAHDGQTGAGAYYYGHGAGPSVPISWAPIMGVGYSVSMVQWNNGDYVKANNTQDDLYLIGSQNGFGLYPGGSASGKILSLPFTSGQSFEGGGLLQRASDQQAYVFSTTGGTFTASVRPSSSYGNVDERLELLDSGNAVLAVSDLPAALSASLSSVLKAGTYRLVVRAAGTGPKPVGGYTVGYSEYGSLGGYVLSGSAAGVTKMPLILAGTSDLNGVAGKPFSATVGVSQGARLSLSAGTLPAGITFDPAAGVFAGTPLLDTVGMDPVKVTLSASNSEGSVARDFTFNIAKDVQPLTAAFGFSSVRTTTPQAPWVGVFKTAANGSTRIVAESGYIPNGASTKVQLVSTVAPDPRRAASWTLLTFWWKASSESAHDSVQCLLDGVVARDFATGNPLVLSGETDWVKQTVRLASPSPLIEFAYTKDANLSSGRDRVWVYVESIGQPPVVSGQPPAVTSSPASTVAAQSSFTLNARVDGALSVQWFKDGVTLKDGVTSTGSTISGSATGSLTVSKAGAADAGNYWLVAANPAGTVSSEKAVVTVASAPVITQQIVLPAVIKVGDPINLSIAASGTAPMAYQWKKNGVLVRYTNVPSVQIASKAVAADAGRYSVSVVNALGTANSAEVSVILPAAASK